MDRLKIIAGKVAILLPLLCMLPYCGWSQYNVRCVVMDTLNSRPAIFASVVAIRTSDSVIETYTRADGNGAAVLHVPAPGKYIVRITYPGFAEYHDLVQVTGAVTELGTIAIISKERLLKEVVVTRQLAAIKIKGDTTEYVADSFRTKENATVEDLLKKLPGIQVDKDGKITAQGAEVKKILVDGEEFFSDDPKVVTKGLQANVLDKVQVFDKKSDQATFTGIDDGEKTKTINLQLKEEKKKGFFGKLDGGGGTDGYFQNQAMINAFKSKRQFSAFGINSNTDKAGLGWGDNDKFGANTTNVVIEDGQMYTYNSASDDDFSGWGGKYRGEGLPHTNTGGAHYADKWGGEKYHISVNYRAAQQNVEIGGVTVTQYALPVVQTATKNQFSDGDRNAADLMFEWTADSTTSIKVTADGGRKHMKTLTGYATTAQNMEGVIQTINNRTITGNNTANYLNASCLLKKKFARKGRTFSADFRENYKENQNDGFLNSVVIHRDTNSGGADTTVAAQRKSATSDAQLFSGKLVYTEPISKKSFLEINYMLTVNNSLSSNYSYNSPGGYNEAVDSLYSSNYQYNITTNKGGLNYKVITEKISLAAGASFSNAHYTQTDKLWQTNSLVRDYPNVFPSATLTYKFKKQTSLYVSYQGNTRQPTINEIQPLRQNIDPLNQTIGNPDLKQEFANRVSLRYNDYKMLSGRSTWLSFTFRQVNDAISTRQIVSPAGNTVQYINVSGNYSLSMYASKGYKIKKPDVNLNGYVNSSISRLNNIINDTANTSVNSNYSVGLRTSYTKRDKLELSVDPSVSWNGNKYSVSRFSNDYWTVAVDLSGSVTLPANVEINTSINVSVRQRTELYPRNNNVVRWNAWVSKKLLSNKQLELRASVFDILNQNIGYSREAVNGMVTENRYTTIMRYGMLNVIWNFSHTPGGAAPAAK